MKKTLFIMLLCIISSCSRENTELQFNQQNLRKMIGLPKESIYKLLGEPNQTFQKEGKTYLIYNTMYQNYMVPISQTYNNPGSSRQTGMYIPQTCTTIFTIVSSVVQSVDTSGDCLW